MYKKIVLLAACLNSCILFSGMIKITNQTNQGIRGSFSARHVFDSVAEPEKFFIGSGKTYEWGSIPGPSLNNFHLSTNNPAKIKIIGKAEEEYPLSAGTEGNQINVGVLEVWDLLIKPR